MHNFLNFGTEFVNVLRKLDNTYGRGRYVLGYFKVKYKSGQKM